MRTFTILALAVALGACEQQTTDIFDDLDPGDTEPPPDPDLQISSVPKSITTNGCRNTFAFEAELVIRTLDVVEDPARTTGAGVWTFGHLFSQLAGPRDPKALAEEWLETWATSPTLANEVVAGNASKLRDILLGPWGDDNFAMTKAPFRLLAIALRPEAIGTPELRLVFGATSPAGTALPMTVAFEYGVSADFMRRWHEALSPLALGSPAYRTALAALTEEGIHDASKINASALKQLRTNEAAIDFPWDLREFHLTADGGATLARAKLEGQPKVRFNGDPRLAQGVTGAMETYQAVIPSEDFTWSVPNMGEGDRFKLAMSTCAGCHAHETNTTFTHIKPREAGAIADLSPFLQSRTCVSGDHACDNLVIHDQFKDPVKGTNHHFTVQDDRMAALNAVLAQLHSCQ